MLALLAAVSIATEVPAVRVDRLTKGINLSHWWAQAPNYSVERLRDHMTQADFRQLKATGFRHVRLTLEPESMWDRKVPVKLDSAKVALLKADLAEIVREGLAVIVDMHPSDEFKEWHKSTSANQAAFREFWTAVARELKGTDHGQVFFETLNEPTWEDAEAWQAEQGRILAAIRKEAPRHTIIVSGAKWSGLDDFLKMKIYSDRNVVYNFHFYDPFLFTHQGATWGWDITRYLKNVPYPSTPTSVAAIAQEVENQEARGHLLKYGRERWDRTKIDDRLSQVDAFRKRHGVYVTVNEFGVYRTFAPPAARAAYLKDVVEAFDRYRIGWAMWDYAAGFGAFEGAPGQRKPDRRTISALGL